MWYSCSKENTYYMSDGKCSLKLLKRFAEFSILGNFSYPIYKTENL